MNLGSPGSATGSGFQAPDPYLCLTYPLFGGSAGVVLSAFGQFQANGWTLWRADYSQIVLPHHSPHMTLCQACLALSGLVVNRARFLSYGTDGCHRPSPTRDFGVISLGGTPTADRDQGAMPIRTLTRHPGRESLRATLTLVAQAAGRDQDCVPVPQPIPGRFRHHLRDKDMADRLPFDPGSRRTDLPGDELTTALVTTPAPWTFPALNVEPMATRGATCE